MNKVPVAELNTASTEFIPPARVQKAPRTRKISSAPLPLVVPPDPHPPVTLQNLGEGLHAHESTNCILEWNFGNRIKISSAFVDEALNRFVLKPDDASALRSYTSFFKKLL